MSASQSQTAATAPTDAVDPATVPTRTLYTGAKIPAVGLGTFGSDQITAATVAATVLDAGRLGYRHFDCASVYSNEPEIGQSFAQLMAEGVARQDLWVTSKVWNDRHRDVVGSCQQSLRDLRLDYLDLYLVHWPFPNFHPPHCDVSSRSPDARPYIHDAYMDTWRQMEQLVDRGLVRHIGTSNMTIPKLKLVLRDARIKPAANEMELHPHFQQPELFDYVRSNGILPIGYSPIGSPARPARDRTPDDSVDVEDPTVVRIADRLGVHPAVVCIKWAVQRGQVPIPFSVTRRNYLANLRATVTEPLTDQDMADLAQVDRNCRLIKGQVFLWKENQTWEDLWDVNGQITPA
jgi:diketogulonate reductase-like aldo/keto reductase